MFKTVMKRFARRKVSVAGAVILLFFLLGLRLNQHLHQILHHLWVCEQISVALLVRRILQLLERRAIVWEVWVDECIVSRDVLGLKT